MKPAPPAFNSKELMYYARSIALLALSALPAFAGEAFVSEGFLEIPAHVELDAVSAVDVDSKGNIYVLHRGEPPILAFDSDGAYTHGFGEGMFEVAHGLRVDSKDRIWTTDNKQHVLRRFSTKGKLLATLGEEGIGAADETHFKSPDDIGFASTGEFFVADAGAGRIVRLSAKGKYVDSWGKKGKADGEFAAAHGITVDDDDRVIVADRGNDRVQVFSGDGEHLASWSGFGNPFGVLAVGDSLVISDGDADRLIVLSLKDGSETARWGTPETTQLPHLMAMTPDGRLLVTEVDGKRVQILRPQGGLLD